MQVVAGHRSLCWHPRGTAPPHHPAHSSALVCLDWPARDNEDFIDHVAETRKLLTRLCMGGTNQPTYLNETHLSFPSLASLPFPPSGTIPLPCSVAPHQSTMALVPVSPSVHHPPLTPCPPHQAPSASVPPHLPLTPCPPHQAPSASTTPAMRTSPPCCTPLAASALPRWTGRSGLRMSTLHAPSPTL